MSSSWKTVNYFIVNGQYIGDETIINGKKYVTLYLYDDKGSVIGLNADGARYYFIKNAQGDVMGIVDTDGNVVAHYYYNAWGKLLECSDEYDVGNIAVRNPFRYRGYMYDSETGLYYLNSRYYDPQTCRFVNADGLISTGQDFDGNNMFVYCGNNPVMRVDQNGKFWFAALLVVGVIALAATLSSCSSKSTDTAPRSDLAEAPKLDVNKANPNSYNCYGNGIGKQIDTDPTGYKIGDSTAKTYEAVKKDLGGDKNVRKLDSINDSINSDEFKVAMKCGPYDYHFIRLDSGGWYNKSGNAPGLFIDQSIVAEDTWYAIWMNNGNAYCSPDIYYDDETIYFAVKVGWDTE